MRFEMPALPSLLAGETVTVRTPSTSFDGGMDEVTEWSDEAVEGVIVAPAATSGLGDARRPHGTRAAVELAFPRSFAGGLRGRRVVVRGREYAVVGDPQPPLAANCPAPWLLTCEAEAVDG